MRDISVIMSIYGRFNYERLKSAIKSIQNQDIQNLKIIISEQNLLPKFKESAKSLGVRYVFSEPKIINKQPIYRPGFIRNLGLSQVETELVYLTDSDILFRNHKFLDLLKKNLSRNNSLVKPPMRRLVQEDVKDFIMKAELDCIYSVIKKLYFPNDYIATIKAEEIRLKVVEHKNRIYTIDWDLFQKYKKDPSLKGLEPTIFYDIVHCGGVFTWMELVESIGGYCEQYLIWGYEDSDLQWKLKEKFGIKKIPRESSLEVLHLDHPKEYFCKHQDILNKEIFENRQKRGVEEAIFFDKKHNKGFKRRR